VGLPHASALILTKFVGNALVGGTPTAPVASSQDRV